MTYDAGQNLPVRAQVGVKIEDHDRYVRVARSWLLDATQSILSNIWQGLQDAPPLNEPTSCAEHGHHGAPNSLYAYLSIYPRPWEGSVSRHFGHAGLDWLEEQLKVEVRPLRAVLGIERFNSRGEADLEWSWSVWVESDEDDPSWLRLGIECVSRSVGTDPRSVEVGCRWIDFVQSSLQEIDFSFGYIGERAIPLEAARGELRYGEIIKKDCILPACSWVTFCSRQVVERFGGVADLRRMRLFYRVEGLPSGAAILQATQSLAAFDRALAMRIAKTLSESYSRRRNLKQELQARRAQRSSRRAQLP